MRRRTGLTLIELMAALAIAAILAVGVLAVTAGLSRADSIARRMDARTDLRQRLGTMLSADLAHARRYRPIGQGFQLGAGVLLDGGTMELRHGPSTIIYLPRRVGDGSWLARVQRSPNQRDWTELAARGVIAAELKPVAGKEAEADKDGWRPMPAEVSVEVRFDDPAHPAEVFAIRVR